MLRIFSLWKIWRLRPSLNPRTWVPKASTLLPDHRSRWASSYSTAITISLWLFTQFLRKVWYKLNTILTYSWSLNKMVCGVSDMPYKMVVLPSESYASYSCCGTPFWYYKALSSPVETWQNLHCNFSLQIQRILNINIACDMMRGWMSNS
jgi:hypothetical protein